MKNTFKIDGVEIGDDRPPYIIAELSGNHNGDINRAIELIKKAKQSGASGIKLQTYTAKTMTLDHNSDDFLIKEGTWKGRRLFELYEEAHTPWEWHGELFKVAKNEGISIFSTPFDVSAVDYLEELGVSLYKIASFECVDLPLIKYVASKKKPMIISTGMATNEEIKDAVETSKKAGCPHVVLLHCISSYPSSVEDYKLSSISDLKKRFKCLVGLSDHTLGDFIAPISIGLGASLIEKHFTLKRSDGGPDASFSLEPCELKMFIQKIKKAFVSVGSPRIGLEKVEESSMIFRRSIYVVQDIKKGDYFNPKNIRSIRPGYGLPPKFFDKVIGKKAKINLKLGTPLSVEHFE